MTAITPAHINRTVCYDLSTICIELLDVHAVLCMIDLYSIQYMIIKKEIEVCSQKCTVLYLALLHKALNVRDT